MALLQADNMAVHLSKVTDSRPKANTVLLPKASTVRLKVNTELLHQDKASMVLHRKVSIRLRAEVNMARRRRVVSMVNRASMVSDLLRALLELTPVSSNIQVRVVVTRDDMQWNCGSKNIA